MSDNTLRADPAALDDGSTRLEHAVQALRAALETANAGHDDLMTTWLGGSADRAAQEWSDLHSRVTAHLDELADNVAKLRMSAAAAPHGQDADAGDDPERKA